MHTNTVQNRITNEARGLLTCIKAEKGKTKGEIIELIEDALRTLNRTQYNLLKLIVDGDGLACLNFNFDLVCLSALPCVVSILLTLKSGLSQQMGVHQRLNFVLDIIIKMSFLGSDGIKIAYFYATSLKPVLEWLPGYSALVGLALMIVSGSKMVKIGSDYKKSIELLRGLASTDGWLETGAQLSPDAMRAKKALLSNLSITEVCINAKPEDIHALFTHEEFKNIIYPELVRHAYREKMKATNLQACSYFLGLAIFCLCVLSLPTIGVGVVFLPILDLVLIANFVFMMTLAKKLKPQETFELSGAQTSVHCISASLDDTKDHKQMLDSKRSSTRPSLLYRA